MNSISIELNEEELTLLASMVKDEIDISIMHSDKDLLVKLNWLWIKLTVKLNRIKN